MLTKVTAFALLMTISSLSNAAVTVIVNSANNSSLDSKTVQRIFLGKEKKFSDGQEVVAVNLEASNATRQSFDQDVLGRSSSQVSAYWSKLVFTGKGIPPEEKASDADVIEFVKSNPGAIGYIDSSSLTDAVKAINL